MDTIDEKIEQENGFQCRIIEGLLQGEIFNLIKENVIEAFQISKLENFKKLLNEIPIKEAYYVDLECVSPSEIKWNNILSVQNLSYVNKNEFILQKDYLKQVKIKEANVGAFVFCPSVCSGMNWTDVVKRNFALNWI